MKETTTAKDDNELLQMGELPEDPEVGAGPPVPSAAEEAKALKPMRSIGEMLSAVYLKAQDPKPAHGMPSGHGFIDMMLGGFRRGNVTFVGAPTSWGKCLGPAELVMRHDGSTMAARDVCVGDLLMGMDGSPRRVLSTTAGFGPMYRIVPMRGGSWTCNWAHVLTLVETGTRKLVDISVEDFLRRSKTFRRNHRQFHVGVDYAPVNPPEVDPWFLGVWYGDGTKDLKSVSVTTPDQEVVDGMNETASNWRLRLKVRCERGEAKTYALATSRGGPSNTNGGMRNMLQEAMRRAYGDGLGLPVECLRGSRDVRLRFLAGYIDSDGHHKGENCCEIITQHRRWAIELQTMCRSLGLQAYIYDKTGVRGYEDRVYCRLHISGDLSVIPIRVERKKFRGAGPVRHLNSMGISVDPIGDGPYCGWELDGDGRFLLGDMTVTHNSSFSVMATNAISVFGGKVMLISAEDPEATFGKRLMASRSGVNAISLRDNSLQPDDFRKMAEALNGAEDWPYFQDGIGKSVEALCGIIESHCKAANPDLVIVDYLQAIKCEKRCQDRRNEITYIARCFVDAIKNAGSSGLIFSQIRRLPAGQKPTMNDFKESGDVENMAEHVIMGYVEKDDQAAGHDQFGMEIFKRYAIIDKNKDGPRIGVPILMPFDLPTASFVPITGNDYQSMMAETK